MIKNKNKIMLAPVGFIIICCVCYFIAGADKAATKIFMVFLTPAAFACMFYGIKTLLRARNKFMPLNKIAGYIFDILCAAAALFITGAFLYDFILTFDGADLIVISVALAFFNAVVSARVKNICAGNNSKTKNKTKK